MDLRNLFTDDSAVSPVIGVILMVAITVILAAVIGTFVLGLGDQVSQAQPSANIGFSYSNIDSGTDYDDEVTITHKGGDKLDGSSLKITIAGDTVYDGGSILANPGTDTGAEYDLLIPDGTNTTAVNNWGDSSITAGDEIKFVEADSGLATTTENVINNGDKIRVIWSTDNGDSAIIAEGTVQ